MKANNYIVPLLFALSLTAGILGCSSAKEEPECVPAPEGAEPVEKNVTHEKLGRIEDSEKKTRDWCRACVMGPRGWASCQVAYSEKEGEARDVVKARARDRACEDSGFEKGQCPDDALKAMMCKGDPKPTGAEDPGRALQKIFFASKKGGAAAGTAETEKKTDSTAKEKDEAADKKESAADEKKGSSSPEKTDPKAENGE